jgi:hypothetical protein
VLILVRAFSPQFGDDLAAWGAAPGYVSTRRWRVTELTSAAKAAPDGGRVAAGLKSRPFKTGETLLRARHLVNGATPLFGTEYR